MVDNLTESFKAYDNTQIIDYVYKHYPYFSIKSQWNMSNAQSKLARAAQKKIDSQTRKMLFTIGYQGKSIDGYLNELVKHNIGLRCSKKIVEHEVWIF